MTAAKLHGAAAAPLRGAGGVEGRDGAGRLARARPAVLVALAVVAFVVAVALVLGIQGARDASDDGSLVLAARNLEYSARVLEGRSGEVNVAFANTDAVTHTFTVPALGVDLVVASGEAGTTTFRAGPGTYRFVCTVPGHDGPGMRGELRLQ